MTMQIKRKKDNRVVKCILHRVADIPGGVTVETATLGGKALFEGTPLGKGKDGLYCVAKTAQIVTAADATATAYEVAKGHHFKVGDRFSAGEGNGQVITDINKTDPAKDIITVSATLGKAVKVGDVAFESAGANRTPKVVATVIAGSNYDVDPDGDNLWVDAWVIAVVRESNSPVIPTAAASTLKGIHYV